MIDGYQDISILNSCNRKWTNYVDTDNVEWLIRCRHITIKPRFGFSVAFKHREGIQNSLYRVQHNVPVTTGLKSFICLLDGPAAYLDATFEDDISTRGRLGIEKSVRSNQIVKTNIINLGIIGHGLQQLLDGIKLEMPEVRAPNKIKDTVIF